MGARTDTRQRMVASAAALIQKRGVSGTSINGVLEHSGGPRGSVAYHFPQGRTELLLDALRWVGEKISVRLRRGMEEGTASSQIFREICEHYLADLAATNFTSGCPIGAAAQEAFADPDLGPVVAQIISEWVLLLAELLIREGSSPQEAADTALLCIATMEGAITLARVTRTSQPIDLALAAMLPLLSPDAQPKA
jgi:TetR/AcrR family transcriptional regulator, lmrAB and yxaGH operons repressor